MEWSGKRKLLVFQSHTSMEILLDRGEWANVSNVTTYQLFVVKKKRGVDSPIAN